jgi:F0F1-type ATP synthase assembly protein I
MSEGPRETTETTEVRIRRAPKLPVFLILGVVLGVIAALVLTAAGDLDEKVGFGPTFGYLCLWCIPIGLVVFALIGIVLDQVSRRRSRIVTMERAHVEGDESDPEDDPDR